MMPIHGDHPHPVVQDTGRIGRGNDERLMKAQVTLIIPTISQSLLEERCVLRIAPPLHAICFARYKILSLMPCRQPNPILRQALSVQGKLLIIRAGPVGFGIIAQNERLNQGQILDALCVQTQAC